MYIHVGEDVMVRSSEIIAILEKDTVHSSEDIKQYLSEHQDAVVHLANGNFKSMIITKPHVYLSPIAPGTLKKRLLKSGSDVEIDD
ncbi:extracellular matrix regulator RemB [Lederbergia citri]|uniref:DUF370 domain-containing protein n=1 Tax=Lederbergia citri TaxID=2833580 RepID=A0A942YJP8_9BACI|nr:extracellular matrix/biofilm biosynthesis regulator RemA family protein [Lederbergia citri]MBS4196581.1 DUF370 domain-containing protein [Lederbergia citri]